jgi:hypothetical protein
MDDDSLNGILAGFQAAQVHRESSEQQRLERERKRSELFSAQSPVCTFEVDDTSDQFREWAESLAAWTGKAVEAEKSGNLLREIEHFRGFETAECKATVAVLTNAASAEKVFTILDRIRQQNPDDAQRVRGCVSGAVVRVGNDFEAIAWRPATSGGESPPALIKAVKTAAIEIGATAPSANEFARLAEVIGDENSGQILQIAESKKSADRRMLEIATVDARFKGKGSAEWSALLKVTDAAIRQTACWKRWRAEEKSLD